MFLAMTIFSAFGTIISLAGSIVGCMGTCCARNQVTRFPSQVKHWHSDFSPSTNLISCSSYLVVATRCSGSGSAAIWDPVFRALHYFPVPSRRLPSSAPPGTTWPISSTTVSPVPRTSSWPVPSTPVLCGLGRGGKSWSRCNTS